MTMLLMLVMRLLVVSTLLTSVLVTVRAVDSRESLLLTRLRRDVTRVRGSDRRVNPSGFLEKFGYLSRLPAGQHDHAARRRAIRMFQRMYHLRQTGELDEETLAAMAMPRCGMPDVTPDEYTTATASPDQPQSFFVPGYKWSKTDLKYHIRNLASPSMIHPTVQRRAIERAFQMWSDVTPLTFSEVSSEEDGDFKLEFVAGEHRDGPQNAFDGPGGVLAHAFYPQSGETHFDVEEQWVDGDTEDIDLMDGIDLMTVAGHELGHALGLGHSEVPGALMAPYYQGYEPNFSLPDDDRQAIQSLYGSEHEPARPTTATTTTTTTTTNTTASVAGQTTPDYPYSCHVPYRAATQAYDDSVHVFYGRQLWRLTDYGLDSPSYPVDIRTVYDHAPRTVDAAVYSRRTHQTYLFRGDKVWKYYGFRLLGGRTFDATGNAANAMAAVTDRTGTIYLLKGMTCWQFDESSLTVLRQPTTCLQLFPNAPINMDSALRISSQPGFVFFFRGP